MSDTEVTHASGRPLGSGSPRQKTERKVHRWLAARLRRDFPHLRDPRYMTELAVYCSTYILHQRAAKRILQHGGDDPLVNSETGELRSSLDSLRRLALAVSVLGKNLGISPSSRGKVAQEFREAEFEAIRAGMQDDDEDGPALPAPEAEKDEN